MVTSTTETNDDDDDNHQLIHSNCYNLYNDDDDVTNYQSEEEEEENEIEIEIEIEEEEEISSSSSSNTSSFAAEFYRCGSDYSSLLLKQNESKKLKQTNLFQIWGFNKNPNLNNNPSPSHSHYSPPNNNNNNNNKKQKLNNADSLFRNSKPAPFYKKIPGTPFTVDAFRYGPIQACSVYFLTHFHADHYGGLTSRWTHGPIYCTPLTASLVKMRLSVDSSFIRTIEFDVQRVIEGVRVTFLEANHCPGAALIHFILPDGRCYLHTGDFRASRKMQTYPLLLNHRVNVLYLDTTYCNPKYWFPSKEDVLNFVVTVTTNHLRKQPKTLVVVGAYSIGKECVYLAISKALGVKIYANAARRRTLQSFDWPHLSGSLCLHGKDSILHILPMSSLRFETLQDYLKTYSNQFKAVLAFRPTGWTFSEAVGNDLGLIKPNSKGNITIYGVPYSEHSSFTELREFVQFLRPEKIIPTVNVGNAATRDKMQSYFQDWLKR
ncbi:hypothetical protein ACFE04_019132 [Oxalis oulophora]